MANQQGGLGPDEPPAGPSPPGSDATQPTDGGEPVPGYDPFYSTAPTIPALPSRPGRRRLGPLSPRERGVAQPRGLSGMPRNVRITVVALGVLLLCGCCTLSWSTASAIFAPPGAPLVAFPTSPPNAPSATASDTDQSTATLLDTPTAIGGDTTPTPSAGPTDTPCPNPYCNPWGYNFSCCHRIDSPPSSFCSVFPCVNKFWSQAGYVVECSDGRFSHGGGFPRSCKGDGTYWRTLYQP